MRWGHTRATAEVPCSAHVAADMLCQRNGSLNAGETQHARSNQNLFEDGIAKDKARHIVTPPCSRQVRSCRDRADSLPTSLIPFGPPCIEKFQHAYKTIA